MGVWISLVTKQINSPSHSIPQPQWDCLKEILRVKLWTVHKKNSRFHQAEQGFAFSWVFFGLICFFWNETFIGLHFAHLRNISWDGNVQLPTWHCLDLQCQNIYTWLWGLSCHREQCCCSGTCSSFHYRRGPGPRWAQSAASLLSAECDLLAWGPGTLCPQKGCSAETWQAHLGGHGHTAHLCSSCPWSSRYTRGCWHLPCAVLVLCKHEPLFLSLLLESLTLNFAERKTKPVFLIQCDRHDH